VLRNVVVFFAIVIGLFIGLHRSLQSGAFLSYLDKYPHPVWTPRILYAAGQGFYVFQNLPQAATYFSRIQSQFPKSRKAEDATFFYIHVQDDLRTMSREELLVGYQNYVEKYPAGKHNDVVRERIASYRTGAR